MAVIAKGPRDYDDNDSAITHGNRRSLGLIKFTEWKQIVTNEMLKNNDLTKLLYYDTPDALRRSDLTQEQLDELVMPGDNKRIYQYRHISNLAKEKKSYVSMDLSYFKPLEEFRLFSEQYLSGYLYIYILCDIDILETDTGVRSDLILGEVYRSLDGLDSLVGIGKLTIETQLPLWPDNSSYGGYSLGFKVSELK